MSDSSRPFEATFEHAAVGIAHVDPDGRWMRVNQRYCDILGYPKDELLGRNLCDLTHPGDLDRDLAAQAALLHGQSDQVTVEKRTLRKDGSVVWINASRVLVRDDEGAPAFVISVIEDVTARKEAESQLVAGEAQYRAIFDSAVEAIAVIDAAGSIQSVNPALVSMFGYAPPELIGKNIRLLMPEMIARHHDGYLEQYRQTGRRAIIGIGREVTGHRKDGTDFPLDLSVAEWRRDGAVFFTGIMRDVSARKAAEEALISGEARYRAIFDSAVEAIAVIDEVGTIQSVNPALMSIFGYGLDELDGRNIKMLMPDAIARQHDGYLSRYKETGERAIIGIGREVVGQRKDGSIFPLELSVAEWQREGAVFFTGIMRDISSRKEAEAGLRGSEERLRSLQNEFAHLARVNDLGEMAAAIAHEINQPLAAIVNYLTGARYLVAQGFDREAFEELALDVQLAAEQALRAGEIVRRLREFIGQGTGARVIERFDDLVESAMALALIDARTSGIQVERPAKTGDAYVEVDTIQIHQVLTNVIRNAIEAMTNAPPEQRRLLRLATRHDRNANSVELAASDSGPGIAPDIYDRLFEPFVTSKPHGMGMGLSVCRRLLEAHGGSIDVENRPGHGADFRIRLPVTAKKQK